MMPPDYLLERTRRALAEAIVLSKEQGRIFPLVAYETGEGSRSFPFTFEDFMVAIKITDKADNYRRRAASMGSPFFLLAMTFREIVDFPRQVATARETWDETVLDILRGIRPQCVVFIDRQNVGSLRIVGTASETPAIAAIAIHPVKMLGLVAVQCDTGPGRIDFGPVIEVKDGIVSALAADRYRGIFAPRES